MSIKNKNVQILSIEGKDLLTKRYMVNKSTIRKGSLDDSMEVDKLRTLGKNIIKIDKNKKRYYTNEVITVTFNYSCKQDRDLSDEEYERVESLQKAMELVDKNTKKEIVNLLNIAKRKINKKTIREQLYEHGFNINIDGRNKHFVRYKRTSGSARVGKCLFISDRLAKEMIDWSFAGIEHDIGAPMDCAGMEAYISLPTSSAIDRFKLKPENILLIEDQYSKFEDTVMATKLINEQYDKNNNLVSGDLFTDVDTTYIKNNLFDGESLLDKSIFIEKGYESKAILQVRNRFFKGIGINTDIQQFFKDNNITEISQLNGKTVAKDIKDIKLITTPSSVKYLKFGTFEKWLEQIEPNWAICKYEKPQHHFNGMVQTHYQLLNTLGMSRDEMEDFLGDTIDYINLLKNDIAVFKHHLGINSKVESEDEIESKEELSNNIDSSNSFILNMLEINEDFQYTKMCKNYRNESVKSYIKNVRKGHVLVEGNYSVIVSCPYEYLLSSIGKFDGTSEIKPFECVSSKFSIGEELLAVRSPEPTMSNIIMLNNVKSEKIEKYFNTNSREVCYISPIGNNCMELLSSCDFDGDQFLITNNKHLVKAGKRLGEKITIDNQEIGRFLVSTDFTPKSSIKRTYTPLDLADTDIKCSSNKIGEIINLAQILNSVYWDKKFNGTSEEELFDLYKDISNLNILSCIEIDRAKKISPVDASKELRKIREKHNLGKEIAKIKGEEKEVGIRPMFFKYLDGGTNYKFKKFNTGMDYLNDIITKRCKRKASDKEIPLIELLQSCKAKKSNRRTIDSIMKLIKIYKENNNRIWANNSITNKRELFIEEREILVDKLKKYNLTPELIYTMILRIHKGNTDNNFSEYKRLGLIIMKFLFEVDKISFLTSIKVNRSNNTFIIKDNDENNLKLYGIEYKKITKNCTP